MNIFKLCLCGGLSLAASLASAAETPCASAYRQASEKYDYSLKSANSESGGGVATMIGGAVVFVPCLLGTKSAAFCGTMSTAIAGAGTLIYADGQTRLRQVQVSGGEDASRIYELYIAAKSDTFGSEAGDADEAYETQIGQALDKLSVPVDARAQALQKIAQLIDSDELCAGDRTLTVEELKEKLNGN